jgi:hypothetical protein
MTIVHNTCFLQTFMMCAYFKRCWIPKEPYKEGHVQKYGKVGYLRVVKEREDCCEG